MHCYLHGLAIFLSISVTSVCHSASVIESLAPANFSADDVFELEWVRAPVISPDGNRVIWERAGYDRIHDRLKRGLWVTETDTGLSEPLVTGPDDYHSASFSPDGKRLMFIADNGLKSNIMVRWLVSGNETQIAQFDQTPKDLSWSPDGTRLAFSLFTPTDRMELALAPPRMPQDASWAAPVSVIDDLVFRYDGEGFLKKGAAQIYVVPADGGTPQPLTNGPTSFSEPTWSADGRKLFVVGNDVERPEMDPIESEIYEIDISTGLREQYTKRDGPDHSPTVAPNGNAIAWLGYDDKRVSYQQTEVYVREKTNNLQLLLTESFDHSIDNIEWTDDGNALLAQATVEGEIHLVEISLDGNIRTLVTDIGGTSIGRPYSSGDYALHGSGQDRVIAWTLVDSQRPAELAIKIGSNVPKTVTNLNSDLLERVFLPRIEELQVPSRLDGLNIEAWMAIPKGVRADSSAPLILEIHGGPFAMYTSAFSAEIQRYVSEGYVAVWANPRGSTGYGEDFARMIDQAYPGPDYEDLMSVVDRVIELGWVDPTRLFITGGSGGGVLTAYATGMTKRFAAAAVIKPVINWFTMALAADIGVMVSRHWIRENPWDAPDKYFDLSPIRVVGNVATPTLVMVGEDDWRTPAWEAEQWYTALKMQGVPAAYVRVPGAAHNISSRPSNLVAKVDTIMAWFERFDPANLNHAEETVRKTEH